MGFRNDVVPPFNGPDLLYLTYGWGRLVCSGSPIYGAAEIAGSRSSPEKSGPLHPIEEKQNVGGRMKPHKHCELIKAWADGAEIQRRKYASNEWVDTDPDWRVGTEYRIKPRTVKRVGWVNIYRAPGGTDTRNAYGVHPTEEIANTFAGDGCVATLRVAWEETE